MTAIVGRPPSATSVLGSTAAVPCCLARRWMRHTSSAMACLHARRCGVGCAASVSADGQLHLQTRIPPVQTHNAIMGTQPLRCQPHATHLTWMAFVVSSGTVTLTLYVPPDFPKRHGRWMRYERHRARTAKSKANAAVDEANRVPLMVAEMMSSCMITSRILCMISASTFALCKVACAIPPLGPSHAQNSASVDSRRWRTGEGIAWTAADRGSGGRMPPSTGPAQGGSSASFREGRIPGRCAKGGARAGGGR